VKVPVSDLCAMVSPRDYEVSLANSSLELQGTEFVPRAESHVRLRLRRNGAHIEVEGEIFAQLQAPCARCLADSSTSIRVTVDDQWPVCGTKVEAADLLTFPFMEEDGRVVNLGEYGTALLMESLPVRVLCDVECRGLCPTCGANLNEDVCTCGKREVDPRLAVLGRLLNKPGIS